MVNMANSKELLDFMKTSGVIGIMALLILYSMLSE